MNAKTFLLLAAILALFILASCKSGGDDDTSGDDDASGNLIWQDPPASESMTWDDAKTYCENLSFGGYDDWRLPTISELRSLIRGCDGTVTGGACGVTDSCLNSTCWNDPCNGCGYMGGPGSGGAYWPEGLSTEKFWYWSSSPVADLVNNAWLVSFDYGLVETNGVDTTHYVRCVRP